MCVLQSDIHGSSSASAIYVPVHTSSYKVKTWLKDKNSLLKLTVFVLKIKLICEQAKWQF